MSLVFITLILLTGYCILDKNVTIRPGTKLLGSIDHPLVVDKGDTV